jgi:hypothetical protein
MGIGGIRHPASGVRGFVAFLFLAFLTFPAQARECYSFNEVSAEQLLRLHSELMVIAITCRASSRGIDLVPAYTSFTRRNRREIEGAESSLIKHFNRMGEDGRRSLDTLRTRLANEIGEEIARDSAARFCLQRRDKVIQMNLLTPSLVEKEAKLAYAAVRTYKPLCRSDD